MMTGRRFAAVDIGSNAVRLLLSEVYESESGPYFRKISLIRMPIRLGKDAFILGKISPDNADRLLDTIRGFQSLSPLIAPCAFVPVPRRPCANPETARKSAGRFCRRPVWTSRLSTARRKPGSFSPTTRKTVWRDDNFWLFVDVGGGSTEITIFSNGRTVSRSFGIGTIRLLENLVHRSQWKDLKSWIDKHTRGFTNIEAVGSGGNINTIIKMGQCKADRTITYGKMKKVRNHLRFFSYDDRITKLGLKPDRADVIMPALKIYMSVMKWGGIRTMAVPQIGLADGMVRMMYRQHLRSKKKRKPESKKK
jgi:exopolyphosphatase/guanosine-5'-triphosphate,3'-diphosphate pyrophosphatase